jgi:nucleoside phosphorylase
VAIACLPEGAMGVTSAARVADEMLWTFRSLRFGLMVGIGGGVPTEQNDIRLGDVVVSRPEGQYGGVVQYDYGKTVREGRFERIGSLNQPPDVLLRAISSVKATQMMEGPTFPGYLLEVGNRFPPLRFACMPPVSPTDQLFEADYNHEVGEATCDRCQMERQVTRPTRQKSGPMVHYGLIASGNQVIRDGKTRERLRRELNNVLCFEMEAAGLMNNFPCLVIRGICDYADTHKNDTWQSYAAATAAAYAKELLNTIAESQIEATDKLIDTLKSINPFLALTHGEYNTKILDRISQTKFWAKQHDVYIRAQRGTGTWILEDPNFKLWLTGQGNILWCSGIAGVGKSVLASIIIDHLARMFQNDSFGLAWVYVDYRERNSQKMENFSADLLRQLVQKSEKISNSIINTFGKHSWGELKPKLGEYKTLLQEELQKFIRTFVIIDALDEWGTKHQIKELITELLNLKPAIHLLVTSRPSEEIRDLLDEALHIEIRARNEDVMLYLDNHLQNSDNLHRYIKADPTLQDLIKTSIIQSGDGT